MLFNYFPPAGSGAPTHLASGPWRKCAPRPAPRPEDARGTEGSAGPWSPPRAEANRTVTCDRVTLFAFVSTAGGAGQGRVGGGAPRAAYITPIIERQPLLESKSNGTRRTPRLSPRSIIFAHEPTFPPFKWRARDSAVVYGEEHRTLAGAG